MRPRYVIVALLVGLLLGWQRPARAEAEPLLQQGQLLPEYHQRWLESQRRLPAEKLKLTGGILLAVGLVTIVAGSFVLSDDSLARTAAGASMLAAGGGAGLSGLLMLSIGVRAHDDSLDGRFY